MKKLFIFLFLITALFAQNSFIPKNSIYINRGIAQKYYISQKTYLETNSLITLIQNMLNNKKFVNLSYLEELTEVKVNTTVLLKNLLDYLNGKKAFLNTEFENNSNNAGIKRILYDYLNNNLFDITMDEKKDILNSIKSLQFFVLLNTTKGLLKNVNKNNIANIIKNFNLLFNQYVNDIEKLNVSLLNRYSPKIKQILLKNYRIEAKTNLINSLIIFKQFFNKNEKIYFYSNHF